MGTNKSTHDTKHTHTYTTKTTIIMACWTCVDQGTFGVIATCGKFDRFAPPGCHVIIPCVGTANVGTISTRIQSLDVSVETKTLDNVFVNIIISTQYQVLQDSSRMFDAFYKLTDSKGQIRSYIFDVVRSTVPRIKLDDVFTSKEEIAMEVKNMLAKSMEEFGYNIISTLVTDIAPDPKVKNAMNEINAAQRQRVAAKDRAEAEKNMVVNFQKEVDGISSKDVMEMMMMTQYFDTMKEVGTQGGNSTIFVPSGPAAVADASAAIRSGLMQGNVAVAAMQR